MPGFFVGKGVGLGFGVGTGFGVGYGMGGAPLQRFGLGLGGGVGVGFGLGWGWGVGFGSKIINTKQSFPGKEDTKPLGGGFDLGAARAAAQEALQHLQLGGGGTRAVMDVLAFCTAAAEFPLPPGARFDYGTAGFRAPAALLAAVAFRAGGVAACRSAAAGGAPVGLMLTASHNPEADNGVKLTCPAGGMLEQSWEGHATAVVNAPDAPALEAALRAALAAARGPEGPAPPALLLLARDTRPSSSALAAAAQRGAEALGAHVVDLGELTTPQLHWAVARHAAAGGPPAAELAGAEVAKAHIHRLASGFADLLFCGAAGATDAWPEVVIDCANGVGAAAAAALAAHESAVAAGLQLRLVSAGRTGLNHRCGADYVQKARAVPDGVPSGVLAGASLDGDADRCVFFTAAAAETGAPALSLLLDGDRLCCLVALEVCAAVADSGLPLHIGAVQTAYANGGATAFLAAAPQLHAPLAAGGGGASLAVRRARTGVKHLHAEAVTFDIALYWESNGHGALLFSPAARAAIAARAADPAAATPRRAACRTLQALDAISNPAIGDGLSCLLLAEGCLRLRGWRYSEWAQLYPEAASCQLAVRVADRAAVRAAAVEDETRLGARSPPGLQAAIDAAVAAAGAGARAFARASGTEDVVRVYAEGSSDEAAKALGLAVARAVHECAGGLGPAP